MSKDRERSDHQGPGVRWLRTRTESAGIRGNQAPGPFAKVALEYVWDVGDDTLTIWGGEVGSPAFYKGTFSTDRTTVSGHSQRPGGGYESTMTRAA